MLDTKARELKGRAVGRGLRPSSVGRLLSQETGSSEGLGPGAAPPGPPGTGAWRACNKGEPSLS